MKVNKIIYLNSHFNIKFIIMNKITILLIALIAFTFKAQAQFPETFDGPNLPTGWAVFDNGIGTTESWQQDPNGYAFVLWENVADGSIAEDWLASPSYSVTAADPVLTFGATPINEIDYGSTLSVRVQVDSGAGSDQTDPSLYTNVQTFTETDLLPESVFTTAEVDLSSYAGQDVFIAFVYSNDDGDAWAVDNVEFVQLASSAPLAATNPDPVDGSTVFLSLGTDADGNPVNQYVFTWETPTSSDIVSSYVFDLGDDATVANFSTTLSNPSLTLNGLALDTTYYWRITSNNSVGNTVGTVWSFTTESTLSNTNFQAKKVLEHYVSYNTLTIDANQNINQVEIFNMLGQLVKTVNPNSDSSEISLTDLSRDVFIAKVNINGRYQSFKFINK